MWQGNGESRRQRNRFLGKKLFYALPLAAAFGLPIASCAVPPAVPPGSFLVTPVQTTHELVLELQNNPRVAARYLRHFHLSSKGELELALAMLHVKRFSEPHKLPVWFVHIRQGREIMGFKDRVLPAGSLVFVDSDGAPVLIAVCGNPIGKVRLPSPKSVAHNLFNVTVPNLNLAFAPTAPPIQTSSLLPAYSSGEISGGQVAIAPLVPPGLPEAHVTGGFPLGYMALPFLFHGSGGGSPILAALPPQLSSSGAQTPLGVVPEGGLLSTVCGFFSALWWACRPRKGRDRRFKGFRLVL